MAEYDTGTVLYLTSELLVALFSALGNLLVTLTFIRDKRLQTPTNLFVFSLAVVDLLTSAVATPVYVHSMLTKLPDDFRACVCVHSLILTFCTVSIFHLTTVSFDRYMAIVWRRKPIAHADGMRRASIFIGAAWIGGILIGFLPLMGWNAGQPPSAAQAENRRVQKCDFMQVISMRYLMFLFYATIIAPTVVMTFFYGSIYYAVRKQNARMMSARYSIDSKSSINFDVTRKMTDENVDWKRKITSESSKALLRDQSIEMNDLTQANITWSQQRSSSVPTSAPPRANTTLRKRQNAKTKKVIFSLLLVIICFFISWYPLYTMNAVAYYCESCRIEPWWFYGPIVLSHVSSAMNPFIYARTMPGYKEAFIETLTCGKLIAVPTNLGKRRSAVLTDSSVRKSNSQLSIRQRTFDSDDLQVM